MEKNVIFIFSPNDGFFMELKKAQNCFYFVWSRRWEEFKKAKKLQFYFKTWIDTKIKYQNFTFQIATWNSGR